MNAKRLIPALPVLAAFALAAAPAGAATADTQAAVSENWAGYAIGGSESTTNFSDVAGSWTEPTAKCTASGEPTYSAFWVGLGGSSQASDALEQAGTQADCSAGGQASYYAWYELVPAAPVKLAMTIHPGDKMSSKVTVNGNAVTITVSDATTGASVTKNLTTSSIDTSSAEWIAEAPSECQGQGVSDCQPLTLANFGSVTFTNVSATADGHTGTISDSDWTATPVELSPAAEDQYGPASGYGYGYSDGVPGGGLESSGSQTSSAGATPSALSTDGSSFSVAYSADAADTSTATSTGSDGSTGYGDSGSGGYGDAGTGGYGDAGGAGYGYGGGEGYGGGAGYGYGGGGYGDGGYGDGYGQTVYVVPGGSYSYGYGGDSGYGGAAAAYGAAAYGAAVYGY
jgi:hypothetical protein